MPLPRGYDRRKPAQEELLPPPLSRRRSALPQTPRGSPGAGFLPQAAKPQVQGLRAERPAALRRSGWGRGGRCVTTDVTPQPAAAAACGRGGVGRGRGAGREGREMSAKTVPPARPGLWARGEKQRNRDLRGMQPGEDVIVSAFGGSL